MNLDENAAFEPTGSQGGFVTQPEVGGEPQAALEPQTTQAYVGEVEAATEPEPAVEAPVATAPEDASAPAPQTAPSPGDTAARPGASAPKPTITSTLRLPRVEPSSQPDSPDPKLRDVNRDFARWLRNRAGAVGTYLSAHAKLVGLVALALVAFVLGVVLLGMNASKMPTDAQIAADARSMLTAPTYTAGDFAEAGQLALNLVEVESKQHSNTRDDACDVYVTATFSNDSVETQANATLTYVREGDTWTCTAANTGNASHRALAGVSEQRVLAAIDTLLEEADNPDDGRPSLVSLYNGANVQVVDSALAEDGQQENMTLHCQSTGTFVCYECELLAHFKFAPASGAWELASVQVSDGAKDLGFSPLVGTWTGTFRSQEAEGGKCLSAREGGLTVEVTRATSAVDGGASIEGTLSGTAHLHPALTEDANATDGDLQLDAVPFTGALQTGDDSGSGEGSNGIVFVCTTQDTVGGSVSLLLSFGSSKAPDSATATLVSKHSYQDTFAWIIPYEREARFTDTFTLEKA
jgi:hypothetical protein